jgi:hypothetical protein
VPYDVPTTPDLYVAFTMDAPWQGVRYVRSFRNIIDNETVLHHWLLFKQATSSFEGVTVGALGAHPDGEMLFGWAPGGEDMYMDPDVAMEVSGDVSYQLEAHYNNTTGAPQPDASGVELCVTPNKPAHVAGLSWVGTDAILGGTEAVGTCTPSTGEEVHVISATPHMHLKGRHMKVVLTRANGEQEVVHDEPFDFNYQRMYIQNFVMRPGDSLQTTCTYSGPSVFGKGTNDEMCYFFSTAWPAGAMTTPGIASFIHGSNSCIDTL